MTTFVSWLTTQQDRADGVGDLAKHWSEVSPGRVSSVEGVRKVLFREDGGEANWSNHLRMAVDDYTRARAQAILGDTPAAAALVGAPQANVITQGGSGAGTDPNMNVIQLHYDPRINALIGRLDVLERTVQRLVDVNGRLLEQLTPVDWDALWEAATAEIRAEYEQEAAKIRAGETGALGTAGMLR